MIQAMINYKNFITLRDYPTLDEARKVTPALPGKCLGYFDKGTNIFHIEKNAELGPDPESLLDGLTMLQDMRIREYRYLP